MTWYKVLAKDGSAIHGTGVWSLPQDGRPGAWMPEIEQLEPCVSGYHLVRRDGLVEWLGPVISEAEPYPEARWVEKDAHVRVFSRARAVLLLDAWTERTARLFAADCAERVVHLTGPDQRCVESIRVARAYARGEATAEELRAASAAAWAARDAAWAAWAARAARAEWAAARDAMDAAWAARAAWDDARAAASAAAGAAARAAWDDAWAAARAAARDAARAASADARAAAGGGETTWQTERLFQYLTREVA